ERFRDFLKYLSPDFAVPSRRKLSRDLKVMGSKAKSELTHLLSQQNYVATTICQMHMDFGIQNK
ncbi:Hypothetical protein FKW44_016728, partial [Caligus rogercresseyi]